MTEQARNRVDVRKMVICAMLVAVCAVCAQISVPLPGNLVPFTLQTMAVMIVGFLLKPKTALITLGVYFLAGAIGLPVYASAKAGLGALAGPTGGFIWGFVLGGVLISIIYGNSFSWFRAILAVVFGLVVIYLCGCIQLAVVANMNWWQAVLSGCVPYLPGEVIKAIVSVLIARAAAARNFNRF